MRIKSQPQKHQEDFLETIDILSIDQSSNPESNNQNQNCQQEPLYEVESIIMKKINKEESQYLVKWKGYSELTWEPLSNLQDCQLLLDEFDQQQTSNNVIITTKCVSKKAITKSKKKSKKSKKTRTFENQDQIQSFENLGRTIKINGITNQQLKVNFKKSKNDQPKSSWININELHQIAPQKLIQFYESLPAIQALFKSKITASNLSTQQQ
ncbi:unnamed protein product [Paramecium pentaurelia]|uniref:Chromo domain-containing protein n=1 Tax=Paramecium pentaurelia TaxID=43138 RepID=A0A8S1SZM1_9CILI|nr:unnamed protein product [Paramecium pentaurelia]